MKRLGGIRFCEHGKGIVKYLIKPVEFTAIWSQKAEKVCKIIEKPLVKQCFAEGETHIRAIMKTLGKIRVCEHGKSIVKYLINPVEFIVIWSQKAKNVRKSLKNH